MDTPLVKRAYNLGLKVVPNLVEVLGETEIVYYEQHLGELQEAILRGLALPKPELQPAPAIAAPITPPPLFKTADTDLDSWLSKAEEFAEKYLGVSVKLRDCFAIPVELPWKSAIPVFDPGGLTNRDAVEKALKASGLAVWEEVDVMKYSGSEANKKPTLHLIQNSIQPDTVTMSFSPDQLVNTGKTWLNPRGYALAFGLHHFVTNEYLDPQTWTWFPASRLSPGKVAGGRWNPDGRKVRFSWGSSGGGRSGSRLVISVPFKP